MELIGASDGASSSSRNTNWAEVSPLINAACNELVDGELIHGHNFNLYAAMSALEIMDPKMDAGITRKYCSIDEAIDDGAAPVPLSDDKTLDVQRITDIMDHLLACEATWHSGHSLSQTVFSCLYLLRPERTTSHALLHSYCEALRATCKAVISVVSDTRTHEEEDIFTMAYGLPLTEDGDDRCLALLSAVESDITRQLLTSKAPSSRGNASEDVEPLQSNPNLEEGYCDAILCRLRFRKHFFRALSSMRRPQGIGFALARKHIANCMAEIRRIRSSEGFLSANSCGSCGDETGNKTTASGSMPIGFDANINLGVSAPTPPRSISLLSWRKALGCFEKLMEDLDLICSHPLDLSLDNLLRFISNFHKSRPDLISRAYLQHLLVQDGKLYGRHPIYTVVIRAAGLPETTKNDKLLQNVFVTQIQKLTINMLKILCTNTAWQRRKLGKILHDWRVIYVQMELAYRNEFEEQTSLKKNQLAKAFEHFLPWLDELTYWIGHRFLFLGIELDLYAPDDYCMVYWYMFKLAEETHLNREGKKKKGAKETPSSPEKLLVHCQACIAKGLSLLLAVMKSEKNMFRSRSPFNSEGERFFQNFELLLKAGVPENLSYSKFEKWKSCTHFSTVMTYNCFKDALELVKKMKSCFSDDPEMLAEARRLEQVAEHNSIAVSIMCRENSNFCASFQFLRHPFLACVVLKRI